MTSEELEHLAKLVSWVHDIKMSEHVKQKLEHGLTDFTLDDLYNTLCYCEASNIIEYNRTPNKHLGVIEKRVVVRDTNTRLVDEHEVNVCYVISLTTNRLVTSYLNRADDKHKTINMNRYKLDKVR